MKQVILLLLSCASILALPASASADIEDPVKDFADRVMAPEDTMLKVVADIGAGKGSVIFIAGKGPKYGSDRGGDAWDAYVPTGKGYRLYEPKSSSDLFHFRSDCFTVGNFGSIRKGLVSYWPGGSQGGTICGIWISDGILHNEPLMDVFPKGKDAELVKSLFHDHPGVVEEIPAIRYVTAPHDSQEPPKESPEKPPPETPPAAPNTPTLNTAPDYPRPSSAASPTATQPPAPPPAPSTPAALAAPIEASHDKPVTPPVPAPPDQPEGTNRAVLVIGALALVVLAIGIVSIVRRRRERRRRV